MRLDQILNGVALAFLSSELIFGCVAAARFAHEKRA
jgi:hypothetical protein